MHILGISCFYHDSAACLVKDGDILAAAQEERFSRKKHDAGFPAEAVKYCLAEGGVGPGGIDAVAFYDKPITKFGRILETYFCTAPSGLRSFLVAMPVSLLVTFNLMYFAGLTINLLSLIGFAFPIRLRCRVDSSASPSATLPCTDWFQSCLPARTAVGLRPAISRASSMAAA